MKVYIQKGFDKECANVNFFAAMDGFKQMGWEICFFQSGDAIIDNEAENVVVGYIDDVKSALKNVGCQLPGEINYPEELSAFLGRRMWQSTVNTIANNPTQWNVFIKPIHHSKKFTGVLVKSTKDLIGCGNQFEDTEVWCSEPVKLLAEWRCFVRYGRILDVRSYKGNWRYHFDHKIVEQAVNEYKNAPAGYAIDFGLTDRGQTIMIEVNDGYSLGAYGLFTLDYAKLLSARWAQITSSRDYCNF